MHYYNDIDPTACAWIKELISDGLLPRGGVDERSITEVEADLVRQYVSCHFFAGIGGWPLALRIAGWPEDRPIWTASLPCQPFSQAGRKQKHQDERHLFPYFRALVDKCRPPVIVGEQVASPDGRIWLSRVRGNLEELGYVVGAADLCSAGVSAPHIRQRLYWCAVNVADAQQQGLEGFRRAGDGNDGQVGPQEIPQGSSGESRPRRIHPCYERYTIVPCADGKQRRVGLADRDSGRRYWVWEQESGQLQGARRAQPDGRAVRAGRAARGPARDAKRSDGQRPAMLASGVSSRVERGRKAGVAADELAQVAGWPTPNCGDAETVTRAGLRPSRAATGRTGGYISEVIGNEQPADAIPLIAIDEREKIMLIRGYGNALTVPVAVEFMRSVMEVLGLW